MTIYKLAKSVKRIKKPPPGLTWREMFKQSFYKWMLISCALGTGVAMSYEEHIPRIAKMVDATETGQNMAAFTYWSCDLVSRILFGAGSYYLSSYVTPSAFFNIGSIANVIGSMLLVTLLGTGYNASWFHPWPAVFFGISNGCYWMVGS